MKTTSKLCGCDTLTRSRPGSRSEYILPAVAEKDCKE